MSVDLFLQNEEFLIQALKLCPECSQQLLGTSAAATALGVTQHLIRDPFRSTVAVRLGEDDLQKWNACTPEEAIHKYLADVLKDPDYGLT